MEPTRETKATTKESHSVDTAPKTTAEKVNATFLSKVWTVVTDIFSAIGHFFAKLFHIGTAKTSADINAEHPPKPETQAGQTGQKVGETVKETPPLKTEPKDPSATDSAAPQKATNAEPSIPAKIPRISDFVPKDEEKEKDEYVKALKEYLESVSKQKIPPTTIEMSGTEHYELTQLKEKPHLSDDIQVIQSLLADLAKKNVRIIKDKVPRYDPGEMNGAARYFFSLNMYLESTIKHQTSPAKIDMSLEELRVITAPPHSLISAPLIMQAQIIENLLNKLAENNVRIEIFETKNKSPATTSSLSMVPSWVSHLQINKLNKALDFSNATRLTSLRISQGLNVHLDLTKATKLEHLEIFGTNVDRRIIVPASLKTFILWTYRGLTDIPNPMTRGHLQVLGFADDRTELDYLLNISHQECKEYILTHMIDFSRNDTLETFELKGQNADNAATETQPILVLPESLKSLEAHMYPLVDYCVSIENYEDGADKTFSEKTILGITFDASRCQGLLNLEKNKDGKTLVDIAKERGVNIIDPLTPEQIKETKQKEDEKTKDRELTLEIREGINIKGDQDPDFSKNACLQGKPIRHFILPGFTGRPKSTLPVIMPKTLISLNVLNRIEFVDLSFPADTSIESITIATIGRLSKLSIPATVTKLEIEKIEGTLDLSQAAGLPDETKAELEQRFPGKIIR